MEDSAYYRRVCVVERPLHRCGILRRRAFEQVTFLQGSIMDDRTLQRLRMETYVALPASTAAAATTIAHADARTRCRGVFIVADKLSSDPKSDDQRTMLRALAIIKYLQLYACSVTGKRLPGFVG